MIFGTIFKITPSGVLTTLYNFTGTGTYRPQAPPIVGPWGILYGTTLSGANNICGGIYSITPSGLYTELHDFDPDRGEGCESGAPLVLGTDGNFYGTTRFGGASNGGTVFRITPAGKLTVVYSFDYFNGVPLAPVVQGADGNFYGTVPAGDRGIIFKLTPAGNLTILYTFMGTTDGVAPSGLVQATDGNFYGVAEEGGNENTACTLSGQEVGCGTLFQITPSGTFSVIHNFDGTEGFAPTVTPFQHTSGLLYGDTIYGGTGVLCRGDDFKDLCGVFYGFDNSLPLSV